MTIDHKEIKEMGTDIAILKQQSIDIIRRVESYHASIANYEIMRKAEKLEMKEYIGDQNKILMGQFKEHINMVAGHQRVDIEKSRTYCEEENKVLYKAINDVKGITNSLRGRLDKFVYGASGALVVIGVVAWVVERFT